MSELILQTIKWAGNGQELKVLIEEYYDTNYDTFQTVIETLKAKGIYKYKLISTNKDNEH